MRGHGEQSGGPAGLTDHATPDLNDTVTPRQFVVLNVGKDEKSLSQGVWGLEAPKIFGDAAGIAGFPFL